jgi:hypothetical protein
MTPGALTPVRVMLSRSINAYRPHPPHSRAHRDFTDAAYTRCLRCAGAPRRPASGSALSQSRSFSTCRLPRPREARRLPAPSSFADDAGLRPGGRGSALPTLPISGLSVRLRYDLSSCSPPSRDFYFRASDGLVALPTAGYDYGVQLGNLHRWDSHPLERLLASLHATIRLFRGYDWRGRSATLRSSGDRATQVKAWRLFPSEGS